MKKIIFTSYVFAISGCATPWGQSTESKWDVLEDTEHASCDIWPLRDKDLRLEEIKIIHNPNDLMILAEVRKRDGSTSYAYVDFKGKTKIDEEDIKDLNLGESVLPFYGQFPTDKNHFAIIRPQSEASSLLEIREFSNNVVKLNTVIASAEIDPGKLWKVDQGFWALMNQDNHKITYFAAQDGTIKATSFPLQFEEEPILMPLKDHNTNVLNIKRGETPVFQIQKLHINGTTSNAMSLQEDLKEGLESWNAQHGNDGFYLSYITGDSVVGRSSLNISHYNENGLEKPMWTKKLPLNNMHVSEPVWVENSQGTSQWVFLLKWLDSEATIGAYKVDKQGISLEKNVGVFKKGTALIKTFVYGENQEVYAILRNQKGRNWEFQVCKLKNL